MQQPTVQPTIVIVGVSRSGTTALAQSFLNHPDVEVFKDPGRFQYESTGRPSFDHFWRPAQSGTRARVVKYSLGSYTPELCCPPLYPTGGNRPGFIRQIHHVFLIRRPVAVWGSWQAMTAWIQDPGDDRVVRKWRELSADKGIQAGWGSAGLLRLCWTYLFETFSYVRGITPETTSVITHEDLVGPFAERTVQTLSARVGIDYNSDMLTWKIPFGTPNLRLSDGIRRSLDDPERQFIHRTILRSNGLTPGRVPADEHADVDTDLSTAEEFYRHMSDCPERV